MSVPNPIPLALLGRVEDALRKEAHDRCVEKLMWGETVGGLDLGDLLICEAQSMERAAIMESKFVELMKSEYPDTPLLQEKWKFDIIERYLDSKPELVDDMMDELEERADV